ncbi:secretion system protein E [Caldimicrobium thiodismutans]|uniref:Secretion system protein E n=1 Tax=Caldimicrobium thiodismutans TaxID=1653476 RepID=A0A0U5AZX7_9BACT|nr:GspE/PulE family protein [Caldimicrobium thiodismutans]BAU24079.1 secretion system protein E [Caldimicrobium thiodismutans]
MQRKPLGEILKERGLITDDYIKFALLEQKATGEKLGEVLVRVGMVTDLEIARALSEQAVFPFLDIDILTPEPKALESIPFNFAKNNLVLPFSFENGTLKVAISDPFNQHLMNAIQRVAGRNVSFFVTGAQSLAKAIEKFYYFKEHSIEEDLKNLTERLKTNPTMDFDVEDLLNKLLILGIQRRATDLHLIPTQRSLQIFYRVDGILDPAIVFPHTVFRRLINVIKIRSQLDIAETRRPQDGRMSFTFLESKYDLRIATAPTSFGETVVIRYLPTGAQVQNLEYLGFDPEEIKLIDEIIAQPYGMFLITGPTGSGKSTTLFAALRRINLLEKNVLTAEDPVEYLLPLARQTQVSEEIGYTFARAIRAFLRLDPDVILVGEVRDEETATMAVRAALTGHLFLSTLHTNDAISSIFRLKDMGIKADLLSSALKGVIAQRLIRKICPACKEPYKPPKEVLEYYKLPEDREYYRGKGCFQCGGKGYLGRTVVCEIFFVDEELSKLIGEDPPLSVIYERARQKGFKNLREDAKEKVLAGITTPEEIKRVVG